MNLDYTISHTNTNFKFLFMEIPKKTTWRNMLTYFFRWTSCFRIAWIVGLFLCVQLLHAQNSEIKISGSVLDASGEPITGANISVVGSTKGTMTDYKGNFTLSVPPKATLRVSFIGFEPQTIRIGDKTNFKITLKENSKALNEVVVTALGITRDAKSLSYARQTVNTESMSDVRASNMLDMLSGKVAGLQVIGNGGPLASTRVVIRGNGSLSGNNQPLYVIDGVPIMNDMGESGDLDYGNPANSISPDEIESIEVLKGANASALYGSDGANGVILITTKKATRKTGLGVSYNFNMMFSTLMQYPTYQNIYGAGQNVGFERGWNYYSASGNGYTFDPNLPYGIFNPNMAGQDQRCWGLPMLGFDVVGRNGQVKQYSPAKETVENMYQVGKAITNSVSFDKVMDNGSFRFSYTNIHADDILKNFNNLDRHNFNLNSTAKFTNYLSMDLGARYVYEHADNRGFRGNSNRNPLWVIANLPRDATMDELIPWKNPDGTAKTQRGFNNPFWLLNELSNEDYKHWFMGNVTLNVTFTNYLKLRLRAATDMQTYRAWAFTNYNSPWDTDGEYNVRNRIAMNNNYEGLLMYNQRFGDLSINANVGISHQQIKSEQTDSKVNQLLKADFMSLANNAGNPTTSEGESNKWKEAIFGMLSVGYKGAYLDLTARNEWSSALPIDNCSYFYYSAGAGLVFTDMIEIDKNILSFAKLRGSYAQVGNDTGFDNLRNGYTYGGLFNGIAYYNGESLRKNPNLKPEKTLSGEVGVDLRFLDSRLSIDYTYYNKRTKDQIIRGDISPVSGYSQMMYNAGEVKNWGHELTVTAIPVQTKLVTWTTTFNWAKNKSEIVSLIDGMDRYELGSGVNGVKLYAVVGEPYGTLYGNDYKRDEAGRICVQKDGRPKYVSDQVLANVQPDWIGGWRNSVRVWDFDFNLMIDFKKGGNFLSRTAWQGAIDGQTVQSLEGREDFLMSKRILGETSNEMQGVMDVANTVLPGADLVENLVVYPDWERPKGIHLENSVYDESEGAGWAGRMNTSWVSPVTHWTHNNTSSMKRYIYDASYIKLREISIGYTIPKKWLQKTPLKNVRISAVGRNVAILFQNTPKGIDPEATRTTGNAQGFEEGYAQPSATYGFDIKVSF